MTGIWCYAACAVVLYLLSFEQALERTCPMDAAGYVTGLCEWQLGGDEWWYTPQMTSQLRLIWTARRMRGRWVPIQPEPERETWDVRHRGPVLLMSQEGHMVRVYTRRRTE